MNSLDFNRWWSDAKLCFPSLSTWMAKVFPAPTDQTSLLRKWAGVLSDVSIEHALEVNQAMLAGNAAFVGDYDGDKERLPQHVRRLARQMAFERRERVAEPVDTKPSSFPAGKILRRVAEMIEAGITRDDAMAAALKEFPLGKSGYEPRYRCHLCLDVGSIDVAPPWAVAAMLQERFDTCRHRNASARCKCQKPLPTNSQWHQATFEAGSFFRIADTTWPEHQVSDFRAWCEMKRQEFWDSKRDHSFDAFNQREYA